MSSVSRGKVRSWRAGFNTFLPFILGLLVSGCASTPKEKEDKQKDKEVAALRVHLEAKGNDAGAKPVSILRSSPVLVTVEREALLDERDIKLARLVDSMGGFQLVIECNLHGRLALEAGSVTRLGRRMAIASTWETGDGKHTETRWLAAPVFRQALRDGVFAFTPDCSREEAEHIVRGLNHLAVKLENQPKPGKKPDPDAATPSSAADAIKAYQEGR
jgi:hypothetical protein